MGGLFHAISATSRNSLKPDGTDHTLRHWLHGKIPLLDLFDLQFWVGKDSSTFHSRFFYLCPDTAEVTRKNISRSFRSPLQSCICEIREFLIRAVRVLTRVRTYKVVNLALWAERPDVQHAFGDIRTTLNGVSTANQDAGLQLTNQGWVVPTVGSLIPERKSKFV